MKLSLSIQFLVAAVFAFLLLAPSAVASGGPFVEPAQLWCGDAPKASELTTLLPAKATKPGPPDKIIGGPCSWCNSNSSCSTVCDDNGEQSTCGEYGVCDWCGTAIVEIGREWVALSATRKWGIICEFKSYFLVTYKSQNAGCQPFTVCERETQSEPVCCLPCCAVAPGCFGTPCM